MAAQITLQFVTAFTSVILDHSVAPIGRQIGYVFNYKSNLQSLKKQLQKLKDERDMVQHSVDDATRKGEEIEAAVARWMKYADKIIEDAEEIVSEGEEFARKGWFRRSCIGLRSRYRAGKGAAKESKSVVKLQEEGKFDKVSYRGLPQGIWITASKGYEAFESRKHTMNGITETLKDPNVNMVGVYGMGGVGKTTLVKEVAKKAKQDGIFNMVVMA
ncbi:probable disease resistance protein At1g61190 [Carica papaya]|uniref:probable disease resistance protein At1g61190 n=1 Tax=Carica papaya TaxID=3649 RepID=UPI000B8C7922|nr:probable disease resistance protein At1g61190 [Carica papaya]